MLDANDGIWQSGDKTLVQFQIGIYAENTGHSIARDKPSRQILSRSRDGGETWQPEEIEINPVEPGPIDFAHPDFVMQCRGSKFRISYDRGKTWRGDYTLPDIGKKLTA